MVRAQGIAVLALVMLAAAWPALAAPATVTCPKLSAAPTIDGSLGEQEWAQAAALGPMTLVKGKGMPSLTTEIFIGYTQEGIYIGARLFDPAPMQIHCYATERDGAVPADDSFHLLLDSSAAGTDFLHMAVSAAGVMYDAANGDVSANFKWDAASALTGSGWSVEMIARFEGASPADGDVWKMSCFRNSPRVGERSAWTQSADTFPVPAEFGDLIFGGPAARCTVAPVDTAWFGDNEATVTVDNRSDAPMVCKINARVGGLTRRAYSFGMTKLTVPAGSRSRATLPFRVYRGGEGFVQISVQVIQGTKASTLLRTAPMTYILPALGAALDDALEGIAGAWQTWATMPADARPADSEHELQSLLARWRYLDTQHGQRSELTANHLEALVIRAGALREDTEDFAGQLKAASTSP